MFNSLWECAYIDVSGKTVLQAMEKMAKKHTTGKDIELTHWIKISEW